MTSSYAHVMDRQGSLSNRLESPITSNLDNLQAKKNFSVSHLLDLEEAGEMVGTQADESVGEAGRSMLESPGMTSGSDTTQQESKWKIALSTEIKKHNLNLVAKNVKIPLFVLVLNHESSGSIPENTATFAQMYF